MNGVVFAALTADLKKNRNSVTAIVVGLRCHMANSHRKLANPDSATVRSGCSFFHEEKYLQAQYFFLGASWYVFKMVFLLRVCREETLSTGRWLAPSLKWFFSLIMIEDN